MSLETPQPVFRAKHDAPGQLGLLIPRSPQE